MAYTSGTATDYKNLLSILATFAAANGWAILEQSETKLFLCGEGISGLDEIYCGVSTYEDSGNSYYNWELHSSWSYRSGRDFSAMPISSGDDKAFVYLWNSSISYWITASAKEIILVANVGTVYQHMHLGFPTPPATAEQYPYPLLIAGCGSTKARSYSNTSNAAYWNAAVYSGVAGMLCRPGGIWSTVSAIGTDTSCIVSASQSMLVNIITSPGGEYLLEPFVVINGTNPDNYGTIDGLYRISGYNNTAENTITIDGVNYMCFPDCHRSGYADYCALRLS